jgi:hypothetical protein
MNLYFNTKLVKSTIHEDSSSTFYPVVMPKDYEFDAETLQFEILKSVLISYSKLNLKKCVFNIELQSEDNNNEIKNLIKENFTDVNFEIYFKRPYNKTTWLNDIQKHFGNMINEPLLLVMNHDHQFIDHQTKTFENVISKIFPDDNDNFKKVFYYSHIPELISVAENKKYIQNNRFTKINKSLYKIDFLNYQVDSVAIMTTKTLVHIINNISKEVEYFGRIDWKNLFFNKLEITGYFYAREFFRHFEGYYHVTGIRLSKELRLKSTPHNESKIDLYYNRWLNFSILLIKDAMKLKKFNIKKNLIETVEKSIEIFSESYLDEDLNYGIITKDDYQKLKYSLRNKVFYNLNKIYSEIKNENELTKDNCKTKLINLYNSRLKYFKIIRLIKKII